MIVIVFYVVLKNPAHSGPRGMPRAKTTALKTINSFREYCFYVIAHKVIFVITWRHLPMQRPITVLVFVLLCQFLVVTHVSGQPAESSDTPTPPSPLEQTEWSPPEGGPEIRIDGLYIAQADVEGGKGGYAMSRMRAAVTYTYFTFEYVNRTFFWDDADDPAFVDRGGDPWEDLHTLGLKGKFSGAIQGNWRYYFSGDVSSSFEKQFGSPSLDILAAAGYNFSPRFKFRAGAAFLWHEARTIVVPVAALKWWGGGESADEPLFSVDIGLPESTVTYHYSPELSFTGSFLADSKVFRLADTSAVVKKGYVETRDIVLALLVNYSPLPTVTLSAGLGYDFFREIQFYDSDGKDLDRFDVDGALAGRLFFAVRF
jgi:hypothetical protein